jgi:hypothetical protein
LHQKTRPNRFVTYKTKQPLKPHLTGKDKQAFKVKGWRKIFQANGACNQAGKQVKASERLYSKNKLKQKMLVV